MGSFAFSRIRIKTDLGVKWKVIESLSPFNFLSFPFAPNLFASVFLIAGRLFCLNHQVWRTVCHFPLNDSWDIYLHCCRETHINICRSDEDNLPFDIFDGLSVRANWCKSRPFGVVGGGEQRVSCSLALGTSRSRLLRKETSFPMDGAEGNTKLPIHESNELKKPLLKRHWLQCPALLWNILANMTRTLNMILLASMMLLGIQGLQEAFLRCLEL